MEQRQLTEMKSELSGDGYLRNPQRAVLVERWSKWIPTKDQYGRPLRMDPYRKFVMAQLFENQLSELKQFKEKHMLGEDTTTVNTAPFVKYTFPLLRRVWPSLIAPEIVSVQPMSAPVGAIFYFELKYGSNKGKVASGDRLVKDFNRTYSARFVDGELLGTGDGVSTSFSGTLKWLPALPATLKVVAGSVSGVADANGVITGTGIAGGSTVNVNTGVITVNFTVAPASGVNILLTYEYNNEATSLVPQVNIDIALVSVTAKSRKIKALWSSEAADDLKALHGVKKAA